MYVISLLDTWIYYDSFWHDAKFLVYIKFPTAGAGCVV